MSQISFMADTVCSHSLGADSERSRQISPKILAEMGPPGLEKTDMVSESPPPDTGVLPWPQVVGGFFLMFNSWGIAVSYGTFQTYYTSGGLKGAVSPSTIAWVGSIQTFLLLFGAALSGKYFDAGYFRQMLFVGAFMVVFGLMMTSLATEFYQVLLAQGFCVGCGMGLLLVPSVGMPSTWFNKRRGLAVGIVSTGASIAGIGCPILLRHLIPSIGFGWAVRILGFVSLGTLSISIAIMKQRLPPRSRGTIVEYKALKEPEFALYVVGMFFVFLGFFTFYNFVETWAIVTHLDTKGLPVVYILPIVNAASAFGRVIPGFICDYIGPLNTQMPSMMVAGLVVLIWIPIRTIRPLIVIATLYGFLSGAVLAMPPAALASMTKDLTTLGGRFGVMFMAMSFSSLIGSPVTGAIIQSQHRSYTGARIYAGVMIIVASILLLLARMVKTSWKISRKA
jgi:predicted MFS family arabinose efflux permease